MDNNEPDIKISKIILFGDSVLFGIGASQRNYGCGRILRELLKNTHIIILGGRNRNTTRDGLQRLHDDILKYTEPAYVIILFGNNDCRLKGIDEPMVSLFEYKENLKKMIKEIKTNAKIPILSNLQPIDSSMVYKTLPDMRKLIVNIDSPREWHDKYNLICNQLATEECIKLADINSVLNRYGHNVIAGDGLHPNDFGHKIIAQEFLKAIKDC